MIGYTKVDPAPVILAAQADVVAIVKPATRPATALKFLFIFLFSSEELSLRECQIGLASSPRTSPAPSPRRTLRATGVRPAILRLHDREDGYCIHVREYRSTK